VKMQQRDLLSDIRLCSLLLTVLLVLPLVFAEEPFATRVNAGVRAEMRDGVSLVADVYRPDEAGEFPVLLQRTPYNRKGDTEQSHELASHGYIVVVQDTRGRYGSTFRAATFQGSIAI